MVHGADERAPDRAVEQAWYACRVRWLWPVLLLAVCTAPGCSCEQDASDLAADGYVRCHLADPPEGEHRHGALTLRFEERTLTVTGLPDTLTLAVATGPLEGATPPTADVLLLLGDLVGEPLPESDSLLILLAGANDDWQAWIDERAQQREASGRAEGDTFAERMVDATPLRRIILGPIELVPVAGGPARYAVTDGACGFGADDAELWSLPAVEDSTPRVLLSWAAGSATGLLGAPAGDPTVAAIAEAAGAGSGVFAWPRVDPRAARPAGGGFWVTRASGAREPPGWALYRASDDGLRRLDSGEGAN